MKKLKIWHSVNGVGLFRASETTTQDQGGGTPKANRKETKNRCPWVVVTSYSMHQQQSMMHYTVMTDDIITFTETRNTSTGSPASVNQLSFSANRCGMRRLRHLSGSKGAVRETAFGQYDHHEKATCVRAFRSQMMRWTWAEGFLKAIVQSSVIIESKGGPWLMCLQHINKSVKP